MTLEILDPGNESDATGFAPAARMKTLEGAVVGVISNGKQGTNRFFDALESELREAHGVSRVVRLTKSKYSAPAEPGILEAASGCDAVIAGVGD